MCKGGGPWPSRWEAAGPALGCFCQLWSNKNQAVAAKGTQCFPPALQDPRWRWWQSELLAFAGGGVDLGHLFWRRRQGRREKAIWLGAACSVPSRWQTGNSGQSLSSGRVAVPRAGSGTGAGRLPGTLRCRGRLGARRAARHGQHGGPPPCKAAAPPHPRAARDVQGLVTPAQHGSGPGRCNRACGCSRV